MKKYFFRNYSILLFFKIFIVYLFQAQLMADSNGYISESEKLFNNMPFRNYGYPLIIKILSSFFQNWENILVALQILFSFFTSYYIFYLALKLQLSKEISLLIIIIFNFSILFFLEMCILPDSIIVNLFTIIICNFIKIYIQKNRLFLIAFINSILFTICFLLKNQFLFLMPIFLIIFLSLKSSYNYKKIFLSLFLFVSPIFIVSESIKSYHSKKFNQNLVTSSDNTIYLYSLIKPYREFNMQNLNTSDDDFNIILRENITKNDFVITYKIMEKLRDNGYNENEISKKIKKKYIETVLHNPEFFFIKIFYNLKPTSFWSIFQPTLNLSQLYSIKYKDNDYWRFRLIFTKFFQNLEPTNLIILVLIFFEMIIASYIFFYVFFSSTKYVFKKKKIFFEKNRSIKPFFIMLIIFYFLYMLIHLLVHIEPRYMAPVNIIPILGFFILKETKD